MTTNLVLTRIFDNEPLPRHKLTPETLAQGLKRAASDAQIKQHAAALRAKIRSEEGIRRAVTLIEAQERILIQ